MIENKYPKISIVMPSFNSGKYVEVAILSAINQNYPNLEFIVVDGGSTDNSLEIFEKYKAYFSYFISEKDSGHWEADNKGFQLATGEIFYRLNTDDVLMPNSLFIVAEIFSEYSDIEWITGRPVLIDKDGIIRSVDENKRRFREPFFYGPLGTIQLESTFWRRSIWEKAGSLLDVDYTNAHDFELWCRFFNSGKLYSVECILGAFRKHDPGVQLSLVHRSEYIDLAKKARNKHRSKFFKYLTYKIFLALVNMVFVTRVRYKLIFIIESLFYGGSNRVFYSFEEEKWIKN